MSMGVQNAMKVRKDRLVTIGMMLVRLGFVVAAVLGVGMMASLWSRTAVLPFHLLTGAMVVAGLWMAVLRLTSLGKGAGIAWGGAGASVVGAGIGLAAMMTGSSFGVIHLVVMLAAVGMGEAGVAKASKK